jgi:hypothetical protein
VQVEARLPGVPIPRTWPSTALQIRLCWWSTLPVFASTTNSMRWWLSGSQWAPPSATNRTASVGSARTRSRPAQITYCAGLTSGFARNWLSAWRVQVRASGSTRGSTPSSDASMPDTSHRVLDASTAGNPGSLRTSTARCDR